MNIIEAREEESIDSATDPVVRAAEKLVIEGEREFAVAAEFLTSSLKPVQKLVAETFAPILKATHAAHKEAVAAKRAKMAPLESAEAIVKEKVIDFLDGWNHWKKEVEDHAANTCEEMEQRGESPEAVADALREIERDSPGSREPTAHGITTHIRWSAEVTDFKALVLAVADGKAPLDLLQPNQKRLNEMAAGLTEMLAVSGVKPVKKRVVSASSLG